MPTKYAGYLTSAERAELRDGLRSGDVFVPGSRRYGDPASFLLTPDQWARHRVEFCHLVGKPLKAAEALAHADDELHTALRDLETQLAEGGNDRVRVTDAKAQALRDELAGTPAADHPSAEQGRELHALRQALAYAGEGALRRRHHQQQSEQTWCLTLATNAIGTWTTEYHGLAVAHLRRSGRHIDDALLAHVWPAHHENVHLYGSHAVDMDGELAQLDAHGYRPLNCRTDRYVMIGRGKVLFVSSWVRWLLMLPLLAVLIAACGKDEDEPSPGRTSTVTWPGTPTPQPPASPTSRGATPSTDAGSSQVAVGWQKALYGDRWDESSTAPGPCASPVTSALAARYAEVSRGEDTAARKRFVRRRCTAEVTQATAAQPKEVPQREATRWVRLSGTVRTTCRNGTGPGPEHIEATVQVRRMAAGWRVSQRLL